MMGEAKKKVEKEILLKKVHSYTVRVLLFMAGVGTREWVGNSSNYFVSGYSRGGDGGYLLMKSDVTRQHLGLGHLPRGVSTASGKTFPGPHAVPIDEVAISS